MTTRVSMMKPVITGLVIAMVSTFALTGCSIGNKGGKTTCGEYRAMTNEKQTAVVTKMLKDSGQSLANGNIALTMLAVTAYCATLGSNSSTIDEING